MPGEPLLCAAFEPARETEGQRERGTEREREREIGTEREAERENLGLERACAIINFLSAVLKNNKCSLDCVEKKCAP